MPTGEYDVGTQFITRRGFIGTLPCKKAESTLTFKKLEDLFIIDE